MLALYSHAATVPRLRAPRGMLAARRTERRDRVIACAVLVALRAGWVLNFVSVRQLSVGIGDFLAHAAQRQV